MRKRVKKCILLFVCVLIVVVCSGLLFPEQLSVQTGTEVVTERVLIPGGQSVGIQMSVKGALIVGVENQSGPKVGDMIVAVDGQEIDGPQDVIDLVGDKGKTVEITVVRNQKRLNYTVTPYFDAESEAYKLGFWIKEKIAGIGTLTFYDPEHQTFAALGHGIYEPETGVLLETKDGNLLNTRVNQIQIGKSGTPGALGGIIYNFDEPLGVIEKNTEFGVYGSMEQEDQFSDIEPMVIASSEEIEEGPAYILTTINGTDVQQFDVEITKVHKQYSIASRGLELEVTDKELLETCGGIVQGMSGSPIIQNGKIVGAVTHVLVNDPTRGYGIFIENMLEAAE